MKNASEAFESRRALVPAGFRVIALLNGHSRAVVCLARTRPQAVRRAEEFCAEVIGRRNRLARCGRRSSDPVRVVVVEEWIGTVTYGAWKRLPEHQGGFLRVLKPDNGRGSSAKLRSGARVECVLLSEQTRKGGWRARLRKGKLAGPITNTADVPGNALPGQSVTLRIGSLSRDGRRIQFDWLSDSV